MALILLCSKRLATFWDTEKDQAMRHQNSVFHGVLKHVPWDRFDRLVEGHGANARVRRLSTKSQFVALLYGQLSGAASLREIVTGLSSHAVRLYHVGTDPVRRSTFSDANAQRPAAVFSELLAMMMKQAHRGLRRKLAETTYLIDATSARLNQRSAGWARFSAGVCGAKVHVIYDADADRPIYAGVTAANTNPPLDGGEELAVTEGGNILSDRIGFLPARQAKSRRNPMQDPVREVRVATDTGKVLRILSNDLDASAQEIADLYRRRWAIEMFFRWVKQTLKITHFVGTSENAVRIQIAVALIAFLLLRLAQAAQKFTHTPIVFARLIRSNLMHRRPIDNLLHPPPPIIQDQRQMNLDLC